MTHKPQPLISQSLNTLLSASPSREAPRSSLPPPSRTSSSKSHGNGPPKVACPNDPLNSKKCYFCPIAKDPTEAVTRVYPDASNDEFLVFQPTGPVTVGHLLVIPRKHVQDSSSFDVFGRACAHAAWVASYLYPNQPYNIIVNTGSVAGQTMPHLHVHIIIRRVDDGLPYPWVGQDDKTKYNTRGKPSLPLHVLPADHPDFKPAKGKVNWGLYEELYVTLKAFVAKGANKATAAAKVSGGGKALAGRIKAGGV